MKTLVIGANGQLGCDVVKLYTEQGHVVYGLTHQDLEITDLKSLRETVLRQKPSLVINTAAMHNVSDCETNPTKAFSVNAIGARNLAIVSNEFNYTLVHISTDYVFDGNKQKPYVEIDQPLPLNVYGNSKLSGELFIRSIAQNYIIARVSGLYGKNPCRAKGGDNFVKLMLRLAQERDEVRVVNDEIVTPTNTDDVAAQLLVMTNAGARGVYHVTSQGSCSWYQFAQTIYNLAGINTKLAIADPGEFAASVPRPKYSVLENAGLTKLGLCIMPRWEDSLKKYLNLLITSERTLSSD